MRPTTSRHDRMPWCQMGTRPPAGTHLWPAPGACFLLGPVDLDAPRSGDDRAQLGMASAHHQAVPGVRPARGPAPPRTRMPRLRWRRPTSAGICRSESRSGQGGWYAGPSIGGWSYNSLRSLREPLLVLAELARKVGDDGNSPRYARCDTECSRVQRISCRWSGGPKVRGQRHYDREG